jgi:ankyrin repeat protein
MAPETMVEPSCIERLIKASPVVASKVNMKRQTPLRLHCQRRNASVEVAKLLLEAHPDAMQLLDGDDGWAPIHYVAANGNFTLLRYMVETYPESARVRTSNQETVLHLLCKQHHTTTTNSTVSPSRDVAAAAAAAAANRNNGGTGSGKTELVAAVELLLQADPDSVLTRDSKHSYTPLHLSVCKGGDPTVTLQVVRRLLECNPRVATIVDCENYLPLHHACEIGCSLDIVQALLESYHPAVEAMTRKNDTALSLACTCNRSVDTVKMLITANPQALIKKNDYGFAPLHCVCRAYQPRMGIVGALLDARPSCVHLKTNAGETPLHLASSNSGVFVGVLQLLTTAQNNINTTSSQPKKTLTTALIEDESKVDDERVATASIVDSEEVYQRRPATQNAAPTRLSVSTANTRNKIGNTPCKFILCSIGWYPPQNVLLCIYSFLILFSFVYQMTLQYTRLVSEVLPTNI